MNKEKDEERKTIRTALAAMATGDLLETSKALLATLGYRSERTLELSGTVDDFIQEFPAPTPNTKTEQALREDASSVKLLFQFTSDEVSDALQQTLFEPEDFEKGDVQSFLFYAVDLKKKAYSRTEYAQLTREINKRLIAPSVVFFRVEDHLTVGFTNRRPSKTDAARDVLGHVTLIKDIRLNGPHRGHVDILCDLSLEACVAWMTAKRQTENFEGLLAAWLAMLDTEALNKAFYRRLFAWFQWAVAEAKFPTDEARILNPEEHVIRLITRLLFIWFLKEKRLVAEAFFNEVEMQEALTEEAMTSGDAYYRVVLQNLCFATLNTEIGKRGFSSKNNTGHRNFSRYRYKDQMQCPDQLLDLFAETPFINGGLFECLDSEAAVRDGGYRIDCFSDTDYNKVSLPDVLFFDAERGLLSLFQAYKFTVEENTPIEQEVALDPELLGRVFENLLAAYTPETGATVRKQTGSYYTPRPIVDYMVVESLVAALSAKCSPTDKDVELWKERLHYLLDYAQAFEDASEWFDDVETANVVHAISDLKILDPAVGSGAFPMGMLHRLTLALRRLDPDNSRWEKLQKQRAAQRAEAAFETQDDQTRREELVDIDETFKRYRDSDFGRKLYLIQNSLFGVDIQPVACQIAKLRFFISLAIEQELVQGAANFGIKPLPNLETRFLAANTLIGLHGDPTLMSEKALDLERALSENRERHFHATTRRQKLACKRRDAELRGELAVELKNIGMPADAAEKIAHWDPYDQNAAANWFDPEWMFGVAEGFDVVIGNPPYAKSEHVSENYREKLKTHYGWVGDLYDHFIFAGFAFVSDEGLFSYIANDSFVTFSTKRRIRDLFLENQLIRLVKAPANTFEAQIYTAIFILLKQNASDPHSYMSGEMNFPDFQYRSNGAVDYTTIRKIPDHKFLLSGKNNWVLRLFNFENVEKFCSVLDTGIHSGNVRPKIFFKENNGRRHRLLQGKQIERYALQWDSPKAKYMFCDVNYEPLPIPGIGRGGNPSKRNEYWHFCGDIANHHQPERLLMRQTEDDLIVAYHSEAEHGHFYTDNTLFTILPKPPKTNLKYLLAILNSRLLNFVYHFISQEKGKSQAAVKIKVLQKLPIVVPIENEQHPIVDLVDQILDAKRTDPNVDTVEIEEEIDKQVYALYGLTEDEIRIVEEITE